VTWYSPDGPIVVAPYDQAWAGAFATEADAISAALSELPVSVEHIGSTAVAGLAAKPVIDILLIVPDLASLDERAERLTRLGYVGRGEFGVPGRRFFQKTTAAGIRTHQIHAYADGADDIRRHLDFRDYLRAHPSVADAYASLKVRLAERFSADVERYADAKTSFVRDVEHLAARWRATGRVTTDLPQDVHRACGDERQR